MIKLRLAGDIRLVITALLAAVIPLCAMGLCGMGMFLHGLFPGLIGCGMLLLLLLSRHSYHNPAEPFWKPVCLRTLAVLLPVFCSTASVNGLLYLLLQAALALLPALAAMLLLSRGEALPAGWKLTVFAGTWILRDLIYWVFFPLETMIAVVWLLEGLLWTFLILRKGSKEYNAWHWAVWNGMLALFVVSQLSQNFAHIRNVIETYWHLLLHIGLPFLLPLLLRKVDKSGVAAPHGRLSRSWVYFGSCFLLYICSLGAVYAVTGDYYIGDPAWGVYYVLLSVMAYRTELRHASSGRRGRVDLVPCLLFMAACICVSFVLCVRARTILAGSFGVTVGAEGTAAADWFTYKSAAMDAFFSGDLAHLQDLYAHGGYTLFVNRDTLGAALFSYSKLILAAVCAVDLAVSVQLFFRRTNSAELDRIGRCAAAGYLLRMALYVLLAITMTPAEWIVPPFAGAALMDLVLLAAFLQKPGDGESLDVMEEGRA